jgi:hypothetical protein
VKKFGSFVKLFAEPKRAGCCEISESEVPGEKEQLRIERILLLRLRNVCVQLIKNIIERG